MNDELIKRIDECLMIYSLPAMHDKPVSKVLRDCRAALTEMPRAVAYVDNSSLEELKRELCSGIMVGSFSERHNRTKPLYEAQHDTAALSRKYVPMTNYEIYKIWRKQLGNPKLDEETWNSDSTWKDERRIEAEVIRRAGLEVSND